MKKETISNILLIFIILLVLPISSFLVSFSFVFFVGVTVYVIFLNKEVPFIKITIASFILGIYFLLSPPPSICTIFLSGLPFIISMIYALFGCILYFYNKERAAKIILFSMLSIFLFFLSFIASMPGQVLSPN